MVGRAWPFPSIRPSGQPGPRSDHPRHGRSGRSHIGRRVPLPLRVPPTRQGELHGILPAPVQPDPARWPGAAEPRGPRTDGHQLLPRRRGGERARHPSPRGHRARRGRFHHCRRHDAGHEDRATDGDVPGGRRGQLHPGPGAPRREHASLRGEVRGPAPAPGPPVRDPALQHPWRDRPGPQAPVVGRARDHLRERRGERQGDPGRLHLRDPRARRPLQ